MISDFITSKTDRVRLKKVDHQSKFVLRKLFYRLLICLDVETDQYRFISLRYEYNLIQLNVASMLLIEWMKKIRFFLTKRENERSTMRIWLRVQESKNSVTWSTSNRALSFYQWLIHCNEQYRRLFINLLTSRRVVLRLFNRDNLFKSRWFLSYFLIFEVVEKSMSTKMNMRFWWNQIEVTTKLEDDLIRRKNLRDEQRSRFSEESR
jgi:hypothetical protein